MQAKENRFRIIEYSRVTGDCKQILCTTPQPHHPPAQMPTSRHALSSIPHTGWLRPQGLGKAGGWDGDPLELHRAGDGAGGRHRLTRDHHRLGKDGGAVGVCQVLRQRTQWALASHLLDANSAGGRAQQEQQYKRQCGLTTICTPWGCACGFIALCCCLQACQRVDDWPCPCANCKYMQPMPVQTAGTCR